MAIHLRQEKSKQSADRSKSQRLVITQRTCWGEKMSLATKLELCAVSRSANVIGMGVMVMLSTMFVLVCS